MGRGRGGILDGQTHMHKGPKENRKKVSAGEAGWVWACMIRGETRCWVKIFKLKECKVRKALESGMFEIIGFL